MPSTTLQPASGARTMDLSRRFRWRSVFSRAMDGLVGLMTLAALVPLVSVIYMVVIRGAGNFRWSMLTELPPAANTAGGGFGNALVGTLLLVGIGTLVSVPIGILTAIFLTEYSAGSKSARVIRFAAKILSGLPSILAGVFIFVIIISTAKNYYALSGGLALGILMLPIIILATEEALLRVPRFLREASLALGANRTQTVLSITLPAAGPAIITGVMLAVARAAGETAPIIYTATFFSFWIPNLSHALTDRTASMAVFIYNFATVPYENMIDMAWSASFVLIVLVLVTNIVSHVVANRSK